MPHSVIIPITNVFANGGYTAQVKVGSEGATANLVLDTGSSSLVVQGEDYQPGDDKHLVSTSFAQDVTYGLGGWYGPVVQTTVTMGHGPFSVESDGMYVAVTKKEQQKSFADADGIMGLAYHELNRAYDLTDYLVANDVTPAKTFPWVLAHDEQDDTVREFKTFLKQFPKSYLTPYFTHLEEQGVVGDQFAFLLHRSSIYQTNSKKTAAQLNRHPLNRGFFVMGKPRLHGHLFQGKFKKVKVLDDKYYNVNVRSMRVGDGEPMVAPQLDEKDLNHRTNGIVDSGCTFIILPRSMFSFMVNEMLAINPNFKAVLDPYETFAGVEVGVDMSLIDLKHWPSIFFELDGLDGEAVTLELKSSDYWQVHAPEPNQASFQFAVLEGWPNQCILGLPLIASYFTVFDRQERENGVILFADKP
ncbi:pepsin-like aspartic protease [Marinicella rhabdoformis]|uniref:pepsin-like aspartic protease n=1 Tax=Marinicella rhabdoformis TaxID=2580566 RepID=UPI0012AEBC99|nr:pepsin-like aspartic protease [Marinicella rhabdoformis]